MKNIKNRILVPVNFTEHADRAVRLAVSIASKWKAEVHLLHVVSIAPYTIDKSIEEQYIEAVKSHAIERLKGVLQEAKSDGIKVMAHTLQGNISQQVLSYIEEHDIALVVLGLKGALAKNEMLTGSTTERILRYAECPILTVTEEVDITHLSDIVLATDLQPTHIYITTQLKRLQELSGATIHLVKVNNRQNWTPDRDLEEEVAEFNNTHQFSNFKFKVINSESVEDGLQHYYEQVGAGMLAMPIHGIDYQLSHMNNYYITEKMMIKSPGLLWTCTHKRGT